MKGLQTIFSFCSAGLYTLVWLADLAMTLIKHWSFGCSDSVSHWHPGESFNVMFCLLLIWIQPLGPFQSPSVETLTSATVCVCPVLTEPSLTGSGQTQEDITEAICKIRVSQVGRPHLSNQPLTFSAWAHLGDQGPRSCLGYLFYFATNTYFIEHLHSVKIWWT